MICHVTGSTIQAAVHKALHALFFQFLLPPHTSRDPQKSTSHISGPRVLVFLVQKTRTKTPCTNSLSIVCGGFLIVRGFVSSGGSRILCLGGANGAGIFVWGANGD